MFIKLAVSFLVLSMLAEANGSPFGQLFDANKKPAENAKDTIQQPFQPILGAFSAPLNRKSRAAQSDPSSGSGSPAGLFDIIKKPAEAIKDAFEKPLQPFLGSFGAPMNRPSRQTDDSDSKKKEDDQNKDEDVKKDEDKQDDDKKKGGAQPFKPIFDLFGSHVDRVSGAFSALLSPGGNKQ